MDNDETLSTLSNLNVPRRRALVAEQNDVACAVIARALRGLSFAVERVADASALPLAFEREPAEVVVVDLDAGGHDGLEACAALRKLPGAEDVPIVVTTGITDFAAIERAFDAGASDFVTKPLHWRVLRERVRFLLRARDALSALQVASGRLDESRRRLADAQRLARIGHWDWEIGEPTMLWSDETYRILGLEPHSITPSYTALLERVHPDDRAELEKALAATARDGHGFALDHRIVRADGVRYVHQRAEVLELPVPRISGALQDVTERKQAEERIRQLAFYDPLTGLPNRRLALEHLSRAIQRAQSENFTLGVFFLDIDRFKRINDTLGHKAGDDLLMQVATRIQSRIRSSSDGVSRTGPGRGATVARLAGDEFTLVLPGLRRSEHTSSVARRVLECFKQPFAILGHEVAVSASVGVAVYPDDGADPEALLQMANTAMHHAKETNRGGVQFYSQTMNDRASRSLVIESRLRAALAANALTLNYQPLISAKTLEIVAVEALARWTDTELGPVSPSEFVAVAEETGLIIPLGEVVLRAACDQAAAWRAQGVSDLAIAVNVSTHQVRHADFVDKVHEALRASGLPARALELEITESAIMEAASRTAVVDRLKQEGVRLALDDFGTGYSSFSQLSSLPIDSLKIDRSFVSRIGQDARGEAIVAAIIAMAHRLGIEVIAEGVETPAQDAFLQRESCDLLQGYLHGRPVDAATMGDLLRARPRS